MLSVYTNRYYGIQIYTKYSGHNIYSKRQLMRWFFQLSNGSPDLITTLVAINFAVNNGELRCTYYIVL